VIIEDYKGKGTKRNMIIIPMGSIHVRVSHSYSLGFNNFV